MAGRGIDVHELLKREAFDGPPSYGNHFERSRPAPGGVYGASDQYIILDSFNKLETSRPENGTFTWNFMVQGVTGDQVIGVRDKVDTVVEMQFGQFFMPPLPELPYVTGALGAGVTLTQNNVAPLGRPLSYGTLYATVSGSSLTNTTAWGSSWAYDPLTQTPNGAFTIQVQEAGLQSISDRNGARHHLDYALDIAAGTAATNNRGFNNGYYNSTALAAGFGESGITAAAAVISPTQILASPQGMPGSAWDTYVFTDPLQDVHGITLQFRGPDENLSFQPDSYYNAVFQTDASCNLCMLVTPQQLNNGYLIVGERLFVRAFSSGNRTLDAYMNRPPGLTGTTYFQKTPLPPGVLTSALYLGHQIQPNFPNTPAATAPAGTVAVYFDPNINIAGATITTLAPNPVPEATFFSEYYAKYPSQAPGSKSLAPRMPLPVWPAMVPSDVVVSGATVIATGVTVNIARLRLRVPVRLRRVVQRLTNYMSI